MDLHRSRRVCIYPCSSNRRFLHRAEQRTDAFAAVWLAPESMAAPAADVIGVFVIFTHFTRMLILCDVSYRYFREDLLFTLVVFVFQILQTKTNKDATHYLLTNWYNIFMNIGAGNTRLYYYCIYGNRLEKINLPTYLRPLGHGARHQS